MIYVFEGGSIVFDERTISEEDKKRAVVIEALPEKETPKGKQAILKADKSQEKAWWEYEDLPVDEEKLKLEEELAKLQAEDLNNKEAIAELYMVVLSGGNA